MMVMGERGNHDERPTNINIYLPHTTLRYALCFCSLTAGSRSRPPEAPSMPMSIPMASSPYSVPALASPKALLRVLVLGC